jgi:hypothetical protein
MTDVDTGTGVDTERCDGCDGVETVLNDGIPTELHHVIPDDDAGHSPGLDCKCDPGLEWLEFDLDYGLAVVLHIDQDTGLPVGDRTDEE